MELSPTLPAARLGVSRLYRLSRRASWVATGATVVCSLSSLPLTAADVGLGPVSVEQSHLTYTVRDTVIYDDPNNPANLATWEPYVGVLGNSTFLIGVNTFAEGTTDKQRFAFVLQPAAGGPSALGDHFFTDDGTPYRGPINASRQDGNPQRIAGDPRPGATNIITGAEASPHLNAAFNSDGRWDLGFDRLTDGRYGTVQNYSIDPSTLAQTMQSKAFDAANGRLVDGVAGSNQSSRFGGDLVGLDNGNFVVSLEDRSKVRAPNNQAVFVIVAPDGTILRETTVVAAGDYWSNLAAFRGGFAVRVSGVIYFFDNTGELLGQLDANAASGVAFDRGRGDNTRLGGHVNSPYIYLTGPASTLDGEGNKVPGIYVAAFDWRGQSFVAQTKVDNFIGSVDRAVVAVDALNRITVAFESTPEGYSKKQVVARVFQLDDCQGVFQPLTEPFFPFLNHGQTGFNTQNPSIAMTTRQILFAGKGLVNLENKVDQDPDSRPQSAVYAVVSHPAPAEDPTTPAVDTIPVTVAAAGLSHIVPDTVIFNTPGAPANLGTWEPYVGVLGTSTFLIGANTYAEDSTKNQRMGFVMQPAAGGPSKEGDHFFGDDGTPYRGPINASRQDGNPQRIAGDPRPGAVNIITGGEASPHLHDEFGSDDRWKLGFDRLADGRYGTVQTYVINPSTLTQTMTSKAIDAANGRLTDGVAGSNQSSRFGGDLVGLDNGNFVVSLEDRSRVRAPGNQAVFVIVGPDGSIVKETTVVAASDYWSNLAAYKGGFAIRAAGVIYFYDNQGELKGSVDANAASGVDFDKGRGDGTRIGGHINSPYVYLAGGARLITLEGKVDPAVRVAVFDSRDQSFVTHARVDTRNGATDRVVVAADALDRLVVAFVDKPVGFAANQVAARVFQFDACTKSLQAITPAFFPFVNHEGLDVTTSNPSVAITTRQILVAAKGKVNLSNTPGGDADSLPQSNLYAVIIHPDPQNDPTAPAAGGIRIASISSAAGGKATLTWEGGKGPFTLQKRSPITGAWSDVQTGVAGPSVTVDLTGSEGYFRIVGQ